jgi:hypothetical protein
MEIFQKLGAEVEKAWRDQNYDEADFPALAEKALLDADLPAKVSAWEIAAWALGESNLPVQRDLPGAFGDPPITLFNAARFYIDIYFWLEGTTSIHQHSFCGAFQVLLGSSIHCHYDFDIKERVNFHTAVGSTRLQSVRLLNVGDTQQIRGGSCYIHSLFHLDHPSATIVIRTLKANIEPPQFDYRKPHLALDPFYEESTLIKKQQTLSMLLRTNYAEVDSLVENLLEQSDFQTAFSLLSQLKHGLQSNRLAQVFQAEETKSRFERFFEIVRRRHGALAEILPAIFAEQERQQEIISRRQYVSDPELRFFLALLLNVEGKERIFSLIEERFPENNPVEKILDLTFELANTRILGSTLPNALGIADFGDDYLFVLEGLLKNKSVEQIEKEAREEFPADYAAEFVGKIPTHADTLRASPIFKSLF